MFPSRSFIVSGLTFRSLIHFGFIFMYGVESLLVSVFYKWLTSFVLTNFFIELLPYSRHVMLLMASILYFFLYSYSLPINLVLGSTNLEVPSHLDSELNHMSCFVQWDIRRFLPNLACWSTRYGVKGWVIPTKTIVTSNSQVTPWYVNEPSKFVRAV